MNATVTSASPEGEAECSSLGARATGDHRAGELLLTDLFVDFATVLRLVSSEVRAGRWIDGFLLAAAAHQVLEDHLVQERSLLRRAGKQLVRGANRPVRSIGRWAELADRASVDGLATSPAGRRLAAAGACLGGLVEELWAAARVPTSPEAPAAEALARRTDAIVGELARGGRRLSATIPRLPSCFRSFDQRPQDVEALALEYSRRWPDRRRPLAVIGARTSGSYLAPICAVALRELGYASVRAMTLRPGAPVPAAARAALRKVAGGGGQALVLDDPPTTGSSLARVVEALGRLGFSSRSVVLLLATFDNSGSLPEVLEPASRVVLPWRRWAVHDQLEPARIHGSLEGLLSPVRVIRVERDNLMGAGDRGHLRARYRALVSEGEDREASSLTIVAEGVGLGYLGRHALAVATAVPTLVPAPIGFAEGLLYRRWVPEDARCGDDVDDRSRARAIAGHIVARARALRVDVDRSTHLLGRQPVWEVASAITSRTLGPLGLPLRPPVVDRLVRRALEVRAPSIVDGSPALEHWFVADPEAPAMKVHYAEGAFSHLDLASYDPVFDLAGVAAGPEYPGLATELRAAYERLTAARIEPERWALLQLVHVWNHWRLGRAGREEASRASARIMQAYFAERYLEDLERPADGPWCAIDLDGVLETSPLGFPATTAAGAIALRALVAHGYQPLMVTGRSLGEVIDRCARYGLIGGVAEYGAAVYDHRCDSTIDLAPAEAAGGLERLRSHLARRCDLRVDAAYRRVVRVSATGPGGRRQGLRPAQAQEVLRTSGTESDLVGVPGEDQTDFVPVGVDKGRGVRLLVSKLVSGSRAAPDPARPLALAVGDSLADLPMLELAQLPLAPANGHPALRKAGVGFMPRPYQAGAADAVGRLIGHRPGGCPACRRPELDRVARSFLALLSVQEAGRAGAPGGLARLAAAAAMTGALG